MLDVIAPLFTFYAFWCHGLFLFRKQFFMHFLCFSLICLNCCRLYRAYQKLFASMHDKGIRPHKTQFRRDENYGNKYCASCLILSFGFCLKWMSALNAIIILPCLSFWWKYYLCVWKLHNLFRIGFGETHIQVEVFLSFSLILCCQNAFEHTFIMILQIVLIYNIELLHPIGNFT